MIYLNNINNMKPNEFNAKYANMPIDERFTIIRVGDRDMSINEIYKEAKALQDKIRPFNIELEKLISAFDWYLINKEKYGLSKNKIIRWCRDYD